MKARLFTSLFALLLFAILTSFNEKEREGLYDPEAFSPDSIARMEARLAHSIDIPEAYKLPTLIALGFYPELQDVDIEFVLQPLHTTMAARPTVKSVFQKPGRRSYRIFINDSGDCEIPLESVPFNAQIGVIGHELAHILDYERSKGPGIMGAGLSYATARTKANFEKSIDELTIARGLGLQLHQWADFVLNRSGASEKYKAFKARTYLQPGEILERVRAVKSRQFE
jgi:hypothetical protein